MMTTQNLLSDIAQDTINGTYAIKSLQNKFKMFIQSAEEEINRLRKENEELKNQIAQEKS